MKRILLITGFAVLMALAIVFVRISRRIDRLEDRGREAELFTQRQMIEQEGILVICSALGSTNNSGYVDFERPYESPPIITIFELPPQEYSDAAAKEYATGIQQYLSIPSGKAGDDPATWSIGRRVKAFEETMLKYGSHFQFTATGSGFGWSIDHARFELPLYPFPAPIVRDGGPGYLRTIRWRARGFPVSSQSAVK